MRQGIIQQMKEKCMQCLGEGKIIPPHLKCAQCGGYKYQKLTKSITLEIKKGVNSKQKIVYTGDGDSSPDTSPGDFILKLSPKPHPIFRRINSNLYLTVSVHFIIIHHNSYLFYSFTIIILLLDLVMNN